MRDKPSEISQGSLRGFTRLEGRPILLMIRRGSSVSNDAQDFDLAMTSRTLRSNFGLSRLFLFFTKRGKAARISENKNKKQKQKQKQV